MMSKPDGGETKGRRRREGMRSIAWTITKRVENITNLHSCMELRDGGGWNIPIG
jgi:hypothetical protein